MLFRSCEIYLTDYKSLKSVTGNNFGKFQKSLSGTALALMWTQGMFAVGERGKYLYSVL